ncbi:hypothetical protein [Neisseria chenwenguii]|nr:hypothetical protein [Neisseria chenwenguii]
MRDLREAAALSPELASALTAYSNAQTKALRSNNYRYVQAA